MKKYQHFIRDFELEKNKKILPSVKIKIAAEFKMAV
jgi:hypothetical protein